MPEGFRRFILRGNVVDLAVGVILGAAFVAVVNSLVKDLITPIFGIVGGLPNFAAWTVTVNGSRFNVGSFVNAVLGFLITGAALYWLVIAPVNRLMALRKVEEDPDAETRRCPECRSRIPVPARRCPFCTTAFDASGRPIPDDLPPPGRPDAAALPLNGAVPDRSVRRPGSPPPG